MIDSVKQKIEAAIKNISRQQLKTTIKNQITASNESNGRIAVAIGLGVFMGITPFWGWQMVIAVLLAHFLKLNKVLTLLGTNISFPPVIPFILYLSYLCGGIVYNDNSSVLQYSTGFSFLSIKDHLVQYIIGSFILSTAAALIFCGLVFIVLKFLRKNNSKNL